MTISLNETPSFHQFQIAQQERSRYVTKLVEEWDQIIREALAEFAETLWPPDYLLGFIPTSQYRLQTRWVVPTIHRWWVERDIATLDNRCEAYRLQLSLGELGQPVLQVQSGDGSYNVVPLVGEAIEATLIQVSNDPPLIIGNHQERIR